MGYKGLDVIAEQLGSADGIVMVADADYSEIDDARDFLKRYGC